MTAGAHPGIPAPLTTSPYVANNGVLEPAPKVQWSVAVVGAGCVAMFIGIILAVAGVPAKLTYNENAAGERVKNTSHEPLTTMRSMDSNVKWVKQNTEDGPGQMNFYLTNIDTSEKQIGIMAGAVQAMTASVIAIDENLSGVAKTTTTMGADMKTLAATSTHSSGTMSSLGTNISGLGTSLAKLSTATKALGAAMTKIGVKAKKISTGGTSVARSSTQSLDDVLPSTVPHPETSLDPGTQQGIQ
ncbi:MAG: hypothetical protein H7123_08025 [Thermoleophilia bacterium]|nr:hypothetical protein [Thermoleophilia bacterium]